MSHRARLSHRPTPAHRWAWAVACAGWATLAPPAQANPSWNAEAQQWIAQQLAAEAPAALPLRPEVTVGQLDSRLQLAPCARVEPYLPTGTRLWGRSRIGLRCVQGPVLWNVFLPITVKAWGPAWVVRQPIARGTALEASQFEATEVDWAEGGAPVLARPEDWIGQQADRALAPGQVLRKGMVSVAQAFAAGTQVRVRVQGNGFTLMATGAAITHGYVGETARVRMPNRKILSGTVRNADTVDISL
ncbi:flagellar basal body P-ring formation chaperone FlgA [Macromonas nakdongensis]|uniref:flagellar basal body P-ring formation chaperone FlgA n=1 Tax=Macromonas nakdongensis TaxID=1843082 RepID=UPI000C342732|nr:flagellar basal body P-ring formation chaperone FlgA [Macromonas nakdongensis]